MSRQPRKYLVGYVDAAQRSACHAALSAISGALTETFTVPVVRSGDPAQTPPRHFATDANFTERQAQVVMTACQSFGVRWSDEGRLRDRASQNTGLRPMLARNGLVRK